MQKYKGRGVRYLNSDVNDHDENTGPFSKEERLSIKHKGRTILFYEEVFEESALEVNRHLLNLDERLYKKYRKELAHVGVDNAKLPVINLRIHSPGGDVFSALSIIDVIRNLKCDVHTWVDGSAASGGALIALFGKKRYIGKHGFMLLHQLSGTQSGKYDDMQDELKNSEKIMKLMKSICLEKTKISADELDIILKHEWWLTSEECLNHGLVDRII